MQTNCANALCHCNATPLSVAVLVGKANTAKMERCLGGGLLSLSLSLSLVACAFWHAFALNLKDFFAHFVVVLFRFIVDFTHFIAISSYLVANFSYFFVVLTHLFAYKRHFLGHCAFLKFSNALFLGFLCLSLRAVFIKMAHFVILSLCKKAKNPQR